MGNKSSKKQKLYSVPPNAGRPSACGQPQVDVLESGVFVHWMGPKNSGGCPMIGYIVQHSELDEGIWHSSSPIRGTDCIIENLIPGATYQFRVIGENLVGYAPPSAASEPVVYTTELVPPTFIKTLSNVAAIENEKVEFKVQVTGRPQPITKWFLNDEPLETSEDDEKILVEMQRCIFKRVSSRFEGEIRCVAYNEMGSSESRAELTVGAPPRINEDASRDMIFQVDELLRVKFTFSGRPEPETKWFHNGVRIRENIETIGSCTTLKIPHATRNHRGEYILRLENHLGFDSASVLVTVADKPKPPSVPTVVLLKDNSCVLEWHNAEDDGGCPVQCSIIEYFRLGWDVWLTGGTSRTNCGKIRDLIPGSKYMFRVKSENLYGLSEPSGTSVEIFIPEMSSGLMSPVEESEEENEKPEAVETNMKDKAKTGNPAPVILKTNIESSHVTKPLSNATLPPTTATKPQPLVKPDISIQPDLSDQPRPAYPTRAELRKSLPKLSSPSNTKERSPLLFDHYSTPRNSPIRSRTNYNSRERLNSEELNKSSSLPSNVEISSEYTKPDISVQAELTKSRETVSPYRDRTSGKTTESKAGFEHYSTKYSPTSNSISRNAGADPVVKDMTGHGAPKSSSPSRFVTGSGHKDVFEHYTLKSSSPTLETSGNKDVYEQDTPKSQFLSRDDTRSRHEHHVAKSSSLTRDTTGIRVGNLSEYYTPKSSSLSRDTSGSKDGLLSEPYSPSPTSRSSSVCSGASSHLIYEAESSDEAEDVSIVTSSSLTVLKSGSCAIKTHISREELNLSHGGGSYESMSSRSRNSLTTSKDIEYYSSIFGQTTYGDEPEEGSEDEIYKVGTEPETTTKSVSIAADPNPSLWTSRWRILLIPLFLGLFLKFTLYTNVGVMFYVVYRLVKLFFE